MFAYCGNNPVSRIDASGLWWEDLKDFWEDLCEDYSNFDFENEDEQKVLDSNYFSCYKGIPVVRTDGNRSGSFGIIFITRETNSRAHPEDMVRHEYGHTEQLRQLGVTKYALCIFLPSWREWGNDSYYESLWEVTADTLGGVRSRTHPKEKIDAGNAYLENSKIGGILAWFMIDWE